MCIHLKTSFFVIAAIIIDLLKSTETPNLGIHCSKVEQNNYYSMQNFTLESMCITMHEPKHLVLTEWTFWCQDSYKYHTCFSYQLPPDVWPAQERLGFFCPVIGSRLAWWLEMLAGSVLSFPCYGEMSVTCKREQELVKNAYDLLSWSSAKCELGPIFILCLSSNDLVQVLQSLSFWVNNTPK